MKKGTLKFLGRKNQSLFDTNIKIQEMGNVELVLDSTAIPESGTAKVRPRPTVKHHNFSSESVHAFAVPTPTVPFLSPFNGEKADGPDGGDRLSNGSVISVSDPVEGDIFVPPPPSVAPPPPPTKFIPPPPDFIGDLDSPTLATFQRPPMPPPKPPTLPCATQEDLTLLNPPPFVPPKPPSTPTGAPPAISAEPSKQIPELSDCPKFAPPNPPSEKQQRTQRTPPVKPIRLSSVCSMESLPQAISPAATAPTNRPSSFNPQNTARLYNVPKTSFLSGNGDCDTRPKQILLLEDSGAVNSTPAPVQVNGKAPSTAPPSKPICGIASGTQLDKGLPDVKENARAIVSSKTPQLQPKTEAKPDIISMPHETNLVPTLPQMSPKLIKEPTATEHDQLKFEESPSQKRKLSPLIDRKLRNLKGLESGREGSTTSPFALLQAAKEREKQRSSVSCQNCIKSSASIQHSDSSPNSFVVIPRSTSSSSISSKGRLEESSKAVNSLEPPPAAQTQGPGNVPSLVGDQLTPSTPTLSGMTRTKFPSVSSIDGEKQNVKQGASLSEYAQREDNGPEISMPLLPPPPQFANFDLDKNMESPPAFPPPEPPIMKAPMVNPVPSAVGPYLPPKPKPLTPPKIPPPAKDVKPNVSTRTISKTPVSQLPTPISESQATLLSILQKKMLEMDKRITPNKEADSSCDDWGSPLSDEETQIPVVPRATTQNNNCMLPIKTASLDRRDLESKVPKKQEDSLSKSASSNRPQSKRQYGVSFTVRPGTKQPITPVSRGETS